MSTVGREVTVEHAEEFGAAGVATVYEAYGRRGELPGPWLAITPGRSVAGTARTVLCGPGDNRAVHEAMTRVQPGDVLVVTMEQPEDVALLGDLLVTQAVTRGAAGVVVDAAVRDSCALQDMPTTVLARWRSVRGATKQHRGTVDGPVQIGPTTVHSDDLVVMDDDGACVVAAADVLSTLEAVRARIAKEESLRRRWASGELSYDAYGLRAEDEANDFRKEVAR